MKLAQFRYMDEDRLGVILGDSLIVDLHEAAAALKLPFNFPYTMRELIEFSAVAQETVRFLLYQSERYPHRVKPIPLDEIEWLPPLTRPGKIICINRNLSVNSEPTYYLKPSSSLIGHQQSIQLYEDYGPVHPGPKLAVVIGSPARHISAGNALKHVYGYTIFNDVRGESNSPRFAGCDTFGPMGPWLITKNEIADPHDFNLICKIDGVVVCESSMRQLNVSLAETIAYLSRFHTLEAGDVVCVGEAESCSEIRLQAVDGSCKLFIDGVGVLENSVKNVG